jgi:hypothetical protein
MGLQGSTSRLLANPIEDQPDCLTLKERPIVGSTGMTNLLGAQYDEALLKEDFIRGSSLYIRVPTAHLGACIR